MLLPAKLWRSLAGAGVRQCIADLTHVLEIEDWPGGGGTFDATVYPSMLVARRREEFGGSRPRTEGGRPQGEVNE
jgi:hypothetical protein